jgi:hypothetical protein
MANYGGSRTDIQAKVSLYLPPVVLVDHYLARSDPRGTLYLPGQYVSHLISRVSRFCPAYCQYI